MPTIHWIGKDKVINHHRDVPYKVLEHAYGFDAKKGKTKQPTGSGNKVIHGDNLEALKSLLPEYEGKVKCIYIDPPYNTGNEGWVYNDNVNDPRIKKWLGDVVGKEGEDLSRHDKWLCMMYPRLVLLHKLLAEDGSIWVSIDDHEYANLLLMCHEIFGASNHLATIIWEKTDSPKMDSKHFSSKHDYLVVFAKNFSAVSIEQLLAGDHELAHYNKFDETGNKYYLKPLRAMGGQGETREARPNLYYPLTAPDGSEVYPKRKDGSDGAWRWSREKVDDEAERIEWVKAKAGWSANFRIYASANSTRPIETIWYHTQVGSNRTSKAEVNSILAGTNSFNTPKPIGMLEKVLKCVGDKSSIILDSFAGSGTTAHAVLNLNKQDGGNRKFILIEMMDYAETITAVRVKRVMKGYGEDKKKTEGTGGAFDYYTLGQSLFNAQEQLNEEVSVEKIREYIWYSETRTALAGIPRKARNDAGYYLGTHERTAYYFVYEKNALTTLDHELLATLPTKGERTVIYADNCLLPKKFMEQHGIVFKKIPRDITRF
jgi:adenine-specific DNA-methyltransferase